MANKPRKPALAKASRAGKDMHSSSPKVRKEAAEAPWCMCGRPLGCKRKNENSDGRIDCDHVSGLLARQHGRWPRWGPRSKPKHECGFESLCTKRVLWIVGSTDRHLIQLFHPGINTRSGGLGRLPPRGCARHRDPCRLGHPVAQSRPKPRGGSIAGSSPRSSSHIACNTSAIALSRRFAGKAASQAAYSA